MTRKYKQHIFCRFGWKRSILSWRIFLTFIQTLQQERLTPSIKRFSSNLSPSNWIIPFKSKFNQKIPLYCGLSTFAIWLFDVNKKHPHKMSSFGNSLDFSSLKEWKKKKILFYKGKFSSSLSLLYKLVVVYVTKLTQSHIFNIEKYLSRFNSIIINESLMLFHYNFFLCSFCS